MILGWVPLNVSGYGETWFLGADVFLINFFKAGYKTQIGPPRSRSFPPLVSDDSDEGVISIGSEHIELKALDLLGRHPITHVDGLYQFPVDMTFVSISMFDGSFINQQLACLACINHDISCILQHYCLESLETRRYRSRVADPESSSAVPRRAMN